METINEREEQSLQENDENPYESETQTKHFQARSNSQGYRAGASSVRNLNIYGQQTPAQSFSELKERLRESEHKRQEQIVKYMKLQTKSFEVENENARLKERFKEVIVRGASGILKDEFEIQKVNLEKLLKEHAQLKHKYYKLS